MTVPGSLTIDLSPRAAQLVQRAVESGDFPDAQTAVEAAVHAMSAGRDDWHGYSAEELDRAIDEADASGPPREVDFEEIKREALQRARALSAGA